MWAFLLKLLPGAITGLSGARIAGVVALIIASMVGYYFYDEAMDDAAYSALETKYAQLDTKYQSARGDAQQHATDSAVCEEEYANLKDRYSIDMGTCIAIKKKQEEEISRLKVNNKKLDDYVKANPGSGLSEKIPESLIDILNGE